MGNIRILQLIASLYHGGGERMALNLTNGLVEQGIDVSFCAFGQDIVFGNDTLRNEALASHSKTHFIRSKRLYDIAAIRQIQHYVRNEGIDLIHTHLSDADIVGNLVGRLLNIPVITTLHSTPHQYEILPGGRSWLMRKFVARYATQLVTISDAVRREFLDQWQLNPSRVTTIHNAVDMSALVDIPICPNASKLDEGIVITTVGRLDRVKAQHNLIEAAGIVLKHHPMTKFQIAGKGTLKDALTKQIVDMGIDSQVSLLGLRNDIPNVLAQSDIFVLSSLWEGLPLSAIEAMAAGRPVVLTDVGGNGELIDNHTHGFLVPPDDVKALADVLCQLISNAKLRFNMGNRARSRALEKFGMNTLVKKYQALYQNHLKI